MYGTHTHTGFPQSNYRNYKIGTVTQEFQHALLVTLHVSDNQLISVHLQSSNSGVRIISAAKCLHTDQMQTVSSQGKV